MVLARRLLSFGARGRSGRDDVRRLSENGRRGRSGAHVRRKRERDPQRLDGEPVRAADAAHGRLLRACRARRLQPCAARLRHRLRRDSTASPSRSRRRASIWTPFCQLLRFRREGGENDPKVLLVAPMSGHFATLLRGTIRTLLRDHQVFITDWKNPRNVRLEDGGFNLRGLHPAPDRFRQFYRRGLPHRGGLPADRLGAGRDRGDGAGQFQRPAGEPDPDGRPDRLPRRADQGQRARDREADRVVPHQHDRRGAGQVRRAPGGGSIRASCSSAPS